MIDEKKQIWITIDSRSFGGIESHIDMLAQKIGADRFEFRRNNVLYPAFFDLIDSCAERSGYGINHDRST